MVRRVGEGSCYRCSEKAGTDSIVSSLAGAQADPCGKAVVVQFAAIVRAHRVPPIHRERSIGHWPVINNSRFL